MPRQAGQAAVLGAEHPVLLRPDLLHATVADVGSHVTAHTTHGQRQWRI